MATEQLQAVFNAVETVSNALEDINRAIGEQQRALATLNASYLSNTAATETAQTTLSQFGSEADEAARHTSELARAQGVQTAAASASTGANTAAATAAGALGNRIEEAGEQASSAARKLAAMNVVAGSSAISMGALSINVGAFTIALRDLGTQIPILVTTLGTLGAVAGGAATALITLTGALTAFATAGAIQVVEDLENNFSSIEDRAEAMEALMTGLMSLFSDALEPLQDDTSVNIFTDMVEWAARLTNQFAQFFKEIRPMILDFMSNVSEATDDIDVLFNALADGFRIVQPALEGLFVWFANKLPDAILFMSRTVEEMREPLSQATDSFFSMATALIDMAGGAFPAIVSILELLLGAIEAVADVFNFLGDGITEIIFTFGVATFAATKLLGSLDALAPRLVQLGIAFSTIGQEIAQGGLLAGMSEFRSQIRDILSMRFQNIQMMTEMMPTLGQVTQGVSDAFLQFSDNVASIGTKAIDRVAGKLDDLSSMGAQMSGGQLLAFDKEGNFISPDDIMPDSLMSRVRDRTGSITDVIAGGFDRLSGVARSMADGVANTFDQIDAAVTPALNSWARGEWTVIGAIRTKVASMWESLKAYAVYIGSTIKSTVALYANAVATHGVVGALALLKRNLIASAAGFALTVAGALSTAAAFVGGLIPATIATGTALNVAFAGIPALIGLIVTAGALLVGVIGNMGSVTSGATGAWESFKSVLESIGNSLLKVFVPAWNIIVGLFEIILSPVFALIDGFGLIAEALGMGGEEGGGFMQTLLDGFDAVMGAVGGFLSIFDSTFSIIGDLLYNLFIIPFQIAAHVIGIVVDVVRDLWGAFMDMEIVQSIISEIMNWFDHLGKLIDDIVSGAIEMINGLIDTANLIPGVNIEKVGGDPGGEGLRTTADEVRENLARDEEEADSDMSTEPDMNLSFEDSVEQNIDVEADPEDKEQMRRTVKDAMNEANSLQRRREGHGG